MKCPFCGNIDTKVIDSRAMEEGTVIKRRRACEKCGERFNTFERLDVIPFTVIKRNGTRESFDRNKILKGILRSCNKRAISMEQMEKIVTEIENYFLNQGQKEIPTEEIGSLVMQKLKDLDEVAYVRFASVYRQFKDVDSFMDELKILLKEKEK